MTTSKTTSDSAFRYTSPKRHYRRKMVVHEPFYAIFGKNHHFSAPSEKAISGAKPMRVTIGTIRHPFFASPDFELFSHGADYQQVTIIN